MAAEMTESADDTLPAPRSLWELLRSSLGIGVVLGVVAVVAVPAWVCLIGIAPSTVAAVALMRAQLQLAVPGAQPEPVDGTGIGWRWVHAGAWVFVGVAVCVGLLVTVGVTGPMRKCAAVWHST